MTKIFTSKIFHLYFLAYFLIVGGVFMVVLGFGSTILSEIHYYTDKITGVKYVLDENNKSDTGKTGIFSQVFNREVDLKPVNQDFSIIIEKIGVDAPVIKNVSVVNEKEYFEALKKGVAHAKGKSLPGENGNVFLFAHSSIEFWKMGPYATVFNQLRRLENNDIIYLVYQGREYKYRVFNKLVVSGFDTKPYDLDYKLGSVLTLQTCDPPGTTFNRLIIRAYLVN